MLMLELITASGYEPSLRGYGLVPGESTHVSRSKTDMMTVKWRTPQNEIQSAPPDSFGQSRYAQRYLKAGIGTAEVIE